MPAFPKSRFSEVSLSKLLVLCVSPVKVTCPMRAKTGIFGMSVVSGVCVTAGHWPSCSNTSKQWREIPGQGGMRQKRGLLLFLCHLFLVLSLSF